MQINAIIDEIKSLKDSPIRKSAADIHRLLENHKAAFIKKLDAEQFSYLLATFEKLGSESAVQAGTEAFRRDYGTAYNLLTFYLDKII